MTELTTTAAPVREDTKAGEDTVEGVLRPLHDAWISEARRFLEPALDTGADFWTRWGAVRYLSDNFRERFRQERGLVHELRPFLLPEVSERLELGSDQIARSQLELDRIGRRRGTAVEFAAETKQLLTQLRLWCAEVELAAAGIAPELLPAEGTALLALLGAALPASA